MPVARFQMQDGRVGRFEVPEGATPEQAQSLISEYLSSTQKQQTTAPPPTGSGLDNVPEWAAQHPTLYGIAGAAREALGPAVEAGGVIGGAALGTLAGANPAATVAGAGLGYAGALQLLQQADEYLGNVAPQSVEARAVQSAKQALEGATMQAAGPVIAGGVKSTANLIGKGVDTAKSVFGKGPDIATIRAAKIARESMGGKIPQAQVALRSSSSEITPNQALAAQVEQSTGLPLNVPAAQTMLSRSQARSAIPVAGDIIGKQRGSAIKYLEDLAVGVNQTQARQAQKAAKNGLNAVLEPVKAGELNVANVAGKTALELAENVRLEKIANSMRIDAAEGAMTFNDAAKLAPRAMAELEAKGLRPLVPDSVTERLKPILSDPKYAENDEVRSTVKRLMSGLSEWTNKSGVIDAYAVDAIRKNGVAAAIRDLMPTADAKTQKKAAAALMVKVKPLFVDAIESAGGTGYGKYLKDYEAGMHAINQTQMGAKLLDLYKKSPKQFAEIINGDNPKVVEKLFGTGRFDISEQLAPDVVSNLKSIAKNITTSKEAKAQATEGATAFAEVLKDNMPNWFRLNILSRPATVTNELIDKLEARIGKATMNKLTEASKSAEDLDKLIGVLSANERSAFLKAINNPATWDGFKKTGKKYGGGAIAGVNALSKDKENRNALAQ